MTDRKLKFVFHVEDTETKEIVYPESQIEFVVSSDDAPQKWRDVIDAAFVAARITLARWLVGYLSE